MVANRFGQISQSTVLGSTSEGRYLRLSNKLRRGKLSVVNSVLEKSEDGVS